MTKKKPAIPVEIPITGTLDLHDFRPSEIKELIQEYIRECLKNEIIQGRIIHGKGIGTLRELVHSQLRKNPSVKSFAIGEASSGGWGSTSFLLHSGQTPMEHAVAQDA